MTNESELPVLLVVEDDEGLQRQLKWAYEGYRVVCAGDRQSAIDALRAHEPAVVTLDLGLPPDPDGVEEGFATLGEILKLKPDTKVIVATGHGARESALKAIGMGAYDFYKKPVDIDELGLIVARAFHLHEIEEENRRLDGGSAGTVLGQIVSGAPEMLKVAKTIERVASADVSVMLLGASGTGKELLARRYTRRVAARASSSPSIARQSRRTCWKPSCSATSAAHSPVRSSRTSARSSWPRAAHCSSTKWATSRCRFRSSCFGSCRSA